MIAPQPGKLRGNGKMNSNGRFAGSAFLTENG